MKSLFKDAVIKLVTHIGPQNMDPDCERYDIETSAWRFGAPIRDARGISCVGYTTIVLNEQTPETLREAIEAAQKHMLDRVMQIDAELRK